MPITKYISIAVDLPAGVSVEIKDSSGRKVVGGDDFLDGFFKSVGQFSARTSSPVRALKLALEIPSGKERETAEALRALALAVETK